MSDNRNSYNSIIKSISLFGGVKVFQILVGVLKNKCVALILGPEGMGISGMITTSIEMIASLSGIGLQTSSVRDIAKSYEAGNELEISQTTTALRKLVFFTGMLGTILTIIFSHQLSMWSFGNEDYTWAFKIVSIVLLLDQLCVGQKALLQGTFHYRQMAMSTLSASVVGAVICIPVYYLWGIDGIVPVIIISSVINLVFSWYYSRQLSIKNIPLSLKEVFNIGRIMICLGLAFAVTGSLAMGKVYLLRLYIANTGCIEDVGLYTAGSVIATQYINVILTSMGTDYSPRLAALSDNTPSFIEAVNKQTKLLITIVTPLLILFILFVRELTVLLYSEQFIKITDMIGWMMFGMFFRTLSWCLSYTIAARGEAKKYFWSETISMMYSLAFSVLGYKYAGFTGLGMGFFLTYFIYTIHMFVLCKYMYTFKYSKDVLLSISIMLIMASISFLILYVLGQCFFRYIIGVVMLLISSFISYIYVNRMLPIKQYLNKLINKL